MIKIDKSKYYKVTEQMQMVTINNLFARSVIENHVSGSVYVDNPEIPRTFYIVHPYGMSMLLGDNDNEKFNTIFKDYALNKKKCRNKHEWMQAFPNCWDDTLTELFKECCVESENNSNQSDSCIIEISTRVNFKFNRDKYHSFICDEPHGNYSIIGVDGNIFTKMKGSVVPSSFWDNVKDFNSYGIGFSLFSNGKLASTAFSAFVHGNYLELGMETIQEFRGKGFAQITCSALIDYCLENNYEPVWSCRLENAGSYNLAKKLGFEPCLHIPYYRLCN